MLDIYVAKVLLHSEAAGALVAAAGANMKTFAELLVQSERAGSKAREAGDALKMHCREHGC